MIKKLIEEKYSFFEKTVKFYPKIKEKTKILQTIYEYIKLKHRDRARKNFNN